MHAGLKVGDAISNWNGTAPPRNPERWLRSQTPGGVLRLSVRRDGKDTALEVRLAEKTGTSCEVSEDSHASDKARRVREGLLQGETQVVPVH
jgi:predicted RNA polymerase sigma factor